jgi:hypothetical protein
MASVWDFATVVGAVHANDADERLFLECGIHDEFPMEGEEWKDFVFRTFCRQWYPEQEASEELFFGRFMRVQVPV